MFLRSEWLACIGCVYYNAIVYSRPYLDPGGKQYKTSFPSPVRSGTSSVQPKRNSPPSKLCSLQRDHALAGLDREPHLPVIEQTRRLPRSSRVI